MTTTPETFLLRWRDDASGFVAPFAGKLAGKEPMTLGEAQELQRAMPNGGQTEIVPNPFRSEPEEQTP